MEQTIGKKEKQCKNCRWRFTCDIFVISLNLSITYMTTTNNVLNTIMIAFPNPFQWYRLLSWMSEFRICGVLALFELRQINVAFSLGI